MPTETKDVTVTRDIRQRAILPPDKLAACSATVIGVGAIGRQVALQLAAIGMPRIGLVDFDKVGVENLACQGYPPVDIGSYKVASVQTEIERLNPDVFVIANYDRFRKSDAHGNIVFACVDNMDTRKLIARAVLGVADFFVDGRMAAEVIRVITATKDDFRHYEATLFTQEEAYAGSCTAKSTIFTANIAAGMMLSQFSRYLRGMPCDHDILLNLLASELTVT